MSDSSLPHGAQLSWLGAGRRHDADYLARWRGAPETYTAGRPVDESRRQDHYREVIASDSGEEGWERVSDLLMRYKFYPPAVMHHVSDFSVEERWMRAGDRMVQRIHVGRVLGVGFLDALTMNVVCSVVDEPRRRGFTYITTQVHSEVGEWSAWLERHDSDLTLSVHSISRPADHVARPLHPLLRRLQLRAHRLGIEHFKALVAGGRI